MSDQGWEFNVYRPTPPKLQMGGTKSENNLKSAADRPGSAPEAYENNLKSAAGRPGSAPEASENNLKSAAGRLGSAPEAYENSMISTLGKRAHIGKTKTGG